MIDAGVKKGTDQPPSDGAGGGGNDGAAGAAAAAKPKRKIRSQAEILEDIEREEQEQIEKARARAAERKAAVTSKPSIAARKNAALDQLDKYRADVRAALGNDKIDEAAVDAELAKIIAAGVAGLVKTETPKEPSGEAGGAAVQQGEAQLAAA